MMIASWASTWHGLTSGSWGQTIFTLVVLALMAAAALAIVGGILWGIGYVLVKILAATWYGMTDSLCWLFSPNWRRRRSKEKQEWAASSAYIDERVQARLASMPRREPTPEPEREHPVKCKCDKCMGPPRWVPGIQGDSI